MDLVVRAAYRFRDYLPQPWGALPVQSSLKTADDSCEVESLPIGSPHRPCPVHAACMERARSMYPTITMFGAHRPPTSLLSYPGSLRRPKASRLRVTVPHPHHPWRQACAAGMPCRCIQMLVRIWFPPPSSIFNLGVKLYLMLCKVHLNRSNGQSRAGDRGRLEPAVRAAEAAAR